MTLTPTEIEGLRIAIAEEMGWHAHSELNNTWNAPHQVCVLVAELIPLPPYTTSIDAIQAACLERFNGDDKPRFEINFLDPEICNGGKFVHELAALDWCIAFARTSKIWRYKV